jgi:hypothetical protein
MAKRYQRGNQNLYIEEEQTTQWPKDTKGVIRICISKKNRQHNGQKIPKGGNQNLYIEEEQTTQWPKEKVQKDQQRSTKHTYKTKVRVT